MRYRTTLLATLSALLMTATAWGVSPYGYNLIGDQDSFFQFTNAFFTSIAFSALLVWVIRKYAGTPKMVPEKGQALIESIFEGVISTMEPIVGKKMVRPAFPLIASLFLFILIHNWSGLLPGVGAFGFSGNEGYEYFFRPANTDLNNTIALAIAAHLVWFYLIWKHAGPKLILHDIFGNKADRKETPGLMYQFLSLVFLVVGFIELISIGIRPITLSMRLYGNIFGGENMLDNIFSLAGPVGYAVAAVPFYFLELLVGFVQALVFCLLVSVYIGLFCNHGDEAH